MKRQVLPRFRPGRGLFLVLLLASAPAGASAAYLNAPNNLVLEPGGTVTVPIYIVTESTGVEFQAVDIALSFDANLFTVSNVRAGTLTGAGSGFAGSFNTQVTGQINSTQSGATPLSVAPNVKTSVMLFELTAKQNARSGPSPVNILEVGAAVRTALNEGEVALLPPPTNGFDPLVDGVVTISVVPEPGALSLLALGSSILVAAGLRRHGTRRRTTPAPGDSVVL